MSLKAPTSTKVAKTPNKVFQNDDFSVLHGDENATVARPTTRIQDGGLLALSCWKRFKSIAR